MMIEKLNKELKHFIVSVQVCFVCDPRVRYKAVDYGNVIILHMT